MGPRCVHIDVTQETKALLAEAVSGFQKWFSDKLVGVYLHGSLVMGCFNPAVSDIDLLVIVKWPMTTAEKKDLAQQMLRLAPKAPPKGLELSVVQERYLRAFEYPTPYEFHFSNDYVDRYRAETYDFDAARTDPDLAAHFVITRERGFRLCGTQIREIFPAVPRTCYLQSIARDSEWSFNNVRNGDMSGKCRVPTYAVLNFCRVLAFVENSLITSKAEGGQWALTHLPVNYHVLIQEALNEYAPAGSANAVDADVLQDFAGYSWGIIQRALQA